MQHIAKKAGIALGFSRAPSGPAPLHFGGRKISGAFDAVWPQAKLYGPGAILNIPKHWSWQDPYLAL